MEIKDLFEIMDEMLANRDHYTFRHATEVAEITKRIGQELQLTQEELWILELGSLVHDIGKTAIPDDVLLKPGSFDAHDKRLMEYHPLIGAKLFARHIENEKIIDIILKHHEKLDGSGYPQGIGEKDLNLLVRIVTVADTFDALISQRPYKVALSPNSALQVLAKEAAEGKLDSQVVDVLLRIAGSLELPEMIYDPTAGFMRELEIFRKTAYFREPLTDFYNYRYLLYLDSAGYLGEEDPHYCLSLIHFLHFDQFQNEIGLIVADQVLDEIGQNLYYLTSRLGKPRKRYDGSIMLVRKNIDYIVYAEFRNANDLKELFSGIDQDIRQLEKEWGLTGRCFRSEFQTGFPMENAMLQLFTQVQTPASLSK